MDLPGGMAAGMPTSVPSVAHPGRLAKAPVLSKYNKNCLRESSISDMLAMFISRHSDGLKMGKPLGQFIVSGVLLTAMSPAFAEAYGSGWYGEIQASYGHEDNISRTYKSDEVTDEVEVLLDHYARLRQQDAIGEARRLKAELEILFVA